MSEQLASGILFQFYKSPPLQSRGKRSIYNAIYKDRKAWSFTSIIHPWLIVVLSVTEYWPYPRRWPSSSSPLNEQHDYAKTNRFPKIVSVTWVWEGDELISIWSDGLRSTGPISKTSPVDSASIFNQERRGREKRSAAKDWKIQEFWFDAWYHGIKKMLYTDESFLYRFADSRLLSLENGFLN